MDCPLDQSAGVDDAPASRRNMRSEAQRRFHFISGLPRAGSTLLAAILRQNPAVHAGMMSPVAGLMDALIGQVSAGSELAATVNEAQRERLLRGLFENYYGDVQRPLVFDTNRGWTAQLPALMRLFPEAKLICCVRDVAWIMDSLERQFRKSMFEHTRLFNSAAERATVYTRVEALAGANRTVGFAWHALREACYSDFADRIILLEYDLLVRRPAEVVGLLYAFLEETPFDHDFDDVEFDAPLFDAQLGLKGLHRVEPKVAPQERTSILPPDLFDKYSRLAFWRNLGDSKAYRIVSERDEEPQQTMPAAARNIEAGAI